MILLLLSASALFAQHNDVELIRQRGRVVCIADKADHFPFLYRDRDEWQGIDLLLIERFAEILGCPWEIRIIEEEKDRIAALERGDADLLVSGQRLNCESAKTLLFSHFYTRGAVRILIKRLNFLSFYNTGSDVEDIFRNEGVRIGVSRYSTANESCSAESVGLIAFSDSEEMLRRFSEGELDCCLVDEFLARKLFLDKPESRIFYQLIPVPEINESYCLAVSWTRAGLIPLLNSVVKLEKKSASDTKNRFLGSSQ